MNENLKNYSTQPDPEVWNRISKTLRRRNFRRQALGGSIGMLIAVAAVVGIQLLPYDEQPALASQTLPEVAQLAPNERTVAPPMQESTVQAVPSQQQLPESVSTTVAPVEESPAPKTVAVPVAPVIKPLTVASQTLPARMEEPAPQVFVAEVPSEPTVLSSEDPQPVVAESEAAATPAVAPSPKVISPNGMIEDTILWVPNAFAPASDDPSIATFRAHLNKPEVSILNYRITIFNRSGHQVFHSTDINQVWDGTYKGRPLPQAGYVYIIYYVDKDGLTHQRKGTVALIR